MNVYMTSFFKVNDDNTPEEFVPHSVAVYQPKGYTLPKIAWTDIRKDGKWIRPREFMDDPSPAEAYWSAILDHYDTREDEAWEWYETAPEYLAMCCWCPSDRAAQRQLKEFGSFICHTGPLGEWLESRLGVHVSYDEDRMENMYGVCETNRR